MIEQKTYSMRTSSFFVAAFSADGEIAGVNRRSLSALSEKWFDICKEYLSHYGDDFDAPWSGNLSHIKTKFISESGAALATFSSNERPAISIALVTGHSSEVESSVLKMFVNSLRNIEFVRASAKSSEPFEKIFSIESRPLAIIVPWGDPKISEQDQQVVQELSLHFSAAYLMRD